MIESQGDYIWTINADYVIQARSILKELLAANKEIISGLLVRPSSEFSNFWGKLSSTGWYERIGAVENHPTQDIHLKQLNLHDFWLNKVVGVYFKSVLSHLYKYSTKGYNIVFIVKYNEEGQTKLDPHHDASAYTTNIALNTYGEDYTGGGCNFLHKKVECIGNLKGHLILHPGRITHYHETYPVKTGTRYILVSFNN